MPGTLVPFYSYDGSYIDHITVKRAERLEACGRAKVVRHKKGHVNRVITLRGQDQPRPTALRDYVGQAYSHLISLLSIGPLRYSDLAP